MRLMVSIALTLCATVIAVLTARHPQTQLPLMVLGIILVCVSMFVLFWRSR